MDLVARIINKVRTILYNKFYSEKIKSKYRKRIKNKDFTIICNNCVGGMLYHDLGMKFLSPTINLYFTASDYIKFLENLEFYLTCEIQDGSAHFSSKNGVVGLLNGEIKLYGVHYNSFSELKEKWNERKKRVNLKNIFVIGSWRNGCTDEIVERFCALPYENKVFFSYKDAQCDNSDCVVKIKSRLKEAPIANKMKSFKIRAYDDAFDFISWLNKE